MTMVTKTANTLDEGIQNMMNAAKEDYAKWTTNTHGEQSQWAKDSIAEWDQKITITNGKKYIKVVKENGVFAFIMKEAPVSLPPFIYKFSGSQGCLVSVRADDCFIIYPGPVSADGGESFCLRIIN